MSEKTKEIIERLDAVAGKLDMFAEREPIADAISELVRLAKVEAALPRTADGVPIVPDMTVWLNDPAGVIECRVYSVSGIAFLVEVLILHADGSPIGVSKTELFSTEAAAIAADAKVGGNNV